MAIKIVNFMPLNWHYLSQCEPLPIGNSCFITGVNTSGKSTLLDAFRFLFFVTSNGFNAANGVSSTRNGRPLVSYIRGAKRDNSTDNDKESYVRCGATVTHVVAELYNEETEVSSVIGVSVSMQAITDSNDTKPQWWLLENGHLADLQFTIPVEGGQRYATLDELRKLTPAGSGIKACQTRIEAKAKYSILFGLTDNRFGDPKALDTWARTQNNSIAFNPKEMGNLDKFIKDLVVPEAPIQTDEFKRLLESYRELQKTSTSMEIQCQQLRNVLDICEKYKNLSDLKRINTISQDISSCELLERRVSEQQKACDTYDAQVRSMDSQIAQINSQVGSTRKAIAAFDAEQDVLAIKELRQNLEAHDEKIAQCRKEISSLNNIVSFVGGYEIKTNNLFGSPIVDTVFIDNYTAAQGAQFDNQEAQYQKLTESLYAAQNAVDKRSHELLRQQDVLTTKLAELNQEITELQKGLGMADSTSAVALKKAIANMFQENNILDEPKYLSELLEYKDESWAQAAEAYMGNYRFAIIVMPQNYRKAAAVYKKLCIDNRQIYGVTLVDTASFAGEDLAAPANTLASIFKSKNPYAMAYVNYAYAHVQLVDDASYPPSKNGTFISKDGMKYAGRGYSRMRPVRYIAIGAEARQRRLKFCISEREEAKAEYQAIVRENSECSTLRSYQKNQLMSAFFANGLNLLHEYSALPGYLELRNKMQRELNQMASGNIDTRRAELQKRLDKLDVQLKNALESITTIKAKADNANRDCSAFQEQLNDCESRVLGWKTDEPETYAEAVKELAWRKTGTRKTIKGISEDISTELERCNSGLTQLSYDIILAEKEYNSTFLTNYETAGYESMDSYRAAYNDLISSKIPELKGKTERAASLTQRSFEDKIVGDLRGHIHAAERTLNDINKFMARMNYNDSQYQFAKIKANPGYEDYFNMIRSQNNVASSGDQIPIQRTAFDNEFSSTMSKLFDHIQAEDTPGKGNDWLDYRTYCQFGVTVSSLGNEESTSSLKNSILSGSGAEVQVPCYIILTAALVQQYNRTNRLRGDITDSNSIRVMLIDECFDKMDALNAKTMIHFINQQMGLQLIACAPTDKFSPIGTELENVILVKGNLPLCQRDCYYFTSPEFGRILKPETETEVNNEIPLPEDPLSMEKTS